MEIEVINVQQFPATDIKRIGQFDTLVVYRVDKKRSDSLIIPGANPDKPTIEKAIAEQQKTRGPLLGHKFEIK
jgi:hypothetical protein